MDTNNYYPFGLNHISASFSTSGFGSFYSYKYNGKELQETGLFDYGWRQYMPDLGRWNGIDQLAESYLSTSPYAYVANNPISNTDPDGRWINEDGTIDTSGRTPGFTSGRQMYQQFLGRNSWDGGGNGNYTPFGQTQAYADLMDAFYNGGTAGVSNKDGVLRWWTDYEDPDPTVTGIGAFGMLKLKASYEYDSNMHKISQDIRKYSAYGFTLSKMLQAGYEHASLYGKPPAYTTTSLYYEQKIFGKKILSVKLPFRQMNADKALKYAKFAKGAAIGLGAVSAGLGIYDMVQNGVTTSNTLDTTMSVLAATPTGVTQGIATAYFTLNFISTLTTGKDIGQHLDANGYNLGEYLNNLK
ncbi:RHS repeat-associated core domain-containing protein [Chryseobacterium sp. EZn1]|uniref:RHS repeat-associated core domain-containing protein n=1 Tax=Chryseobacterium cupriresistens TaxID=3366770 RepID=UPI00398499FC